MDLSVDLAKLDYVFTTKPLLIGGKAMEFYGLRPAGHDIDFVVTREDFAGLVALYPDHVKDLFGDLGVCPYNFELWATIFLFDYDALRVNMIERDDCFVVSLEKLLLLKAMAIHDPKNERDLRLIVKKIRDVQYGKDTLFP